MLDDGLDAQWSEGGHRAMHNGKLKIKLCRDWDLGQEECAHERSLAHVESEQCTYSHVLPITIK